MCRVPFPHISRLRNFMKRFFLLILLLLTLATQALCEAPVTYRQDLSSRGGVAWQFQPENGDWHKIEVPGGGWRAQGYTCDGGVYRADVLIPKNAAGCAISIVFDAVNFGADVSAGPSRAVLTPVVSHVDGWVPVTADVTRLAVPGKPLHIEVAVAGRKKFQFNGKYTVPEGATWDPFVEEGILRGVHLVITPLVHIFDVFVQTDVENRTLHAEAVVTNAGSVPVEVTLRSELASANLSDSGKHPAYPKLLVKTAVVPAGGRREVDLGAVSWTLGTSSFWWPNVPYRSGYEARLHQLTVGLSIAGVPVHQYRQRFGFRQFQVRANHYYLNGIRCNLRGDNQQEANFGTDAYGIRPGFGPASPGNAGWPRAVDNLERLNFNVLRIHQIPATPYMLDVCDEKGLMLIEESPLRGSEGGEDYEHGRSNMLNMDRELVLRDRNHPATIIWSAANEWSDPIKDAVIVIRGVDNTRPIIADGVGDLGFPYINIQHYTDGLGALPQDGGTPRTDRPFGEGEALWPADNSRRGFTWMATGTRLRRLKRNDDIRNYILNNAWPNYVPGESPETEVLEAFVKGDKNARILPSLSDPWHNASIRLMQQCFAPVCVCDIGFDQDNKRSNANGDWPVSPSRVAPRSKVTRTLAIFNDEFTGRQVRVAWAVHPSASSKTVLASGKSDLSIPVGEMTTLPVTFQVPADGTQLSLTVTATKSGRLCFFDDAIVYLTAAPSAALFPDGAYLLTNGNSGLGAVSGLYEGKPALVQEAPDRQTAVWHLKNLGGNEVSLTDSRGMTLGTTGASLEDGALAQTEPPQPGAASQIWQVTSLSVGACTLANKASGKLLDVYASSREPGGRITQWKANGGQNQEWDLKPLPSVPLPGGGKTDIQQKR